MKNFQPNDRVKGLFAHSKKTGVVIKQDSRHWVVVMWDGGKRKSTVETSRIQLIEQENDRP